MSLPNFLVGLDFATGPVTSCPILLETALELMKSLKADFCIVPLGSRVEDPMVKHRVPGCSPSAFYPLLEDCSNQSLSLLQQPNEWVRWICGKVSYAEWTFSNSHAIEEEIKIGSFLQLPSIVLPPLPENIPVPTPSEYQDILHAGLELVGDGGQHLLGLIAKVIVRHCHTSASSKLWVPTPLQTNSDAQRHSHWRAFHELRRMCRELSMQHRLPGYHPHGTVNPNCNGMLFPLVSVPEPRADDSEQWSDRDFDQAMCWLGEDVPAFTLPPTAIHSNCSGAQCSRHGEDELLCQADTFTAGKLMEEFVVSMIQRRAAVVIPLTEPSSEAVEGAIRAGRAVVDLHEKWMGKPHVVATAQWEDTLQVPMQPLSDNLQNGVYEAFEKDDAKYAAYGEAIRRRMEHLLHHPSECHSTLVGISGAKLALHVTVLGAGRGPLVTRTLHAAAQFGGAIHLRVTVIEKNPPAAQMLHIMKVVEPTWKEADITIVCGEGGRLQSPLPYKGLCDIVVSELLGSFGDNELSPECIDGLLARYRAEWANSDVPFNKYVISIPLEYTSFVAPVHAQRAHMNAMELSRARPPLQGTGDDSPVFHSPFVVHLTRHISLCATREKSSLGFITSNPKKCFTFRHDINECDVEPLQRRQRRTVRFQATHEGVVTGLAGYFSALLHPPLSAPGDKRSRSEEEDISSDGVQIGSEYMSWFPLYFALPPDEQFVVGQGDVIEAEVARQTDGTSVWNEWGVGVAGKHRGPLRNPNGVANSAEL